MAEGDQSYAQFGVFSTTAGDVNGDGYADLFVTAPWHNGDQYREGRAYVYYGSASGLRTTPAWTAESNQSGAQFGYSGPYHAGDFNGDGYADIADRSAGLHQCLYRRGCGLRLPRRAGRVERDGRLGGLRWSNGGRFWCK